MLGAKPLRNAAANARYLLLQMASQRLGVPADQLEVKDGVVSVKGDASKSVSYAELAGGGDLNDTLKVSGDGFALNVEGAGKPKDPSAYTIVGKAGAARGSCRRKFSGISNMSPTCACRGCCTAA